MARAARFPLHLTSLDPPARCGWLCPKKGVWNSPASINAGVLSASKFRTPFFGPGDHGQDRVRQRLVVRIILHDDRVPYVCCRARPGKESRRARQRRASWGFSSVMLIAFQIGVFGVVL